MKRVNVGAAVVWGLAVVASPVWAETPKSATEYKMDLPKKQAPGGAKKATEFNIDLPKAKLPGTPANELPKVELPTVGVPLKDGKVVNASEVNPTGNGGKAKASDDGAKKAPAEAPARKKAPQPTGTAEPPKQTAKPKSTAAAPKAGSARASSPKAEKASPGAPPSAAGATAK